jgi:two-component system nitrogen regulation response regulator GlnG
MTGRLLVVEDEVLICGLVRATFKGQAGVVIETEHDGKTGLERALRDDFDVVVLDVGLPGLDGLAVLERLKAAHPALPIIMLTGSHEIRTAVRATQLGAFDYLTKPLDPEVLLVSVRRALETHALRVEVEDLRQRVGRGESESLADQMGASPQVRAVVEQVSVVAASDYSVLILGETGTGKELVASAIHRQSRRHRKPFIALDCGAIPEALLESELFGHERGAFTGAERRKAGQFQLADGGTCFLDEIGNLPASLQGKLLRVLESKQVQPVGAERATPMDIRFVAATNVDLQARAAGGSFRADLYFRLAQYTIVLPPLRSRPDDIEHLTRRFLREASIELRRPVVDLPPEAVAVLVQHDWPGNVRELRNVVRQAVLQTRGAVLNGVQLRGALDEPFGGASAAASATPVAASADGRSLRTIADQAARSAERQAITDALSRAGGNKSQAARELQTDYKTLHLKMKALGIEARDFSG